MKILVACEESQAVCKAFRERGHEAYSCDIQECSGGHPEWHIKGNVYYLLNGDCGFYTLDGEEHFISGEWDMIIAHPPCTYLTNGGAVRMFRKDFKEYPPYGKFQMVNVERLKQGMLGRDFFMAIMYARCDKIAIENPIPMSVYMLPPCQQIIQPYEYGEPYAKKTCLWLKGLPKLTPTDIVEPICSWVSGGSKDSHGNKRKNCGTTFRDGKTKSKTFEGIAKAMAEQWG